MYERRYPTYVGIGNICTAHIWDIKKYKIFNRKNKHDYTRTWVDDVVTRTICDYCIDGVFCEIKTNVILYYKKFCFLVRKKVLILKYKHLNDFIPNPVTI